MDEYLCLTVLSKSGESESEFKHRLAVFWTWMVRERPDDYEKIYAETTAFEHEDGKITRKYLIEAPVANALTDALKQQGMDFVPIDLSDLYSKFEAVPPEWFWIEH